MLLLPSRQTFLILDPAKILYFYSLNTSFRNKKPLRKNLKGDTDG
jgi:hypothetical protein